MYQKELIEIGFSKNEAKIYETILSLGECGVSEISRKAEIHRRSVYDTLQRLIEKGLIFPIFNQKENFYRAAEPKKLFEMIREREKIFKRILPGLEYLKKNNPATESAFIYKGLEGYKSYVLDMIRVCEDTYFLGAKFNWNTPGTEHLLAEYDHEMKRKKRKTKTIFDPRVAIKIPESEYKRVGKYKFFPLKYQTPGIMDVFGDYVVTFNTTNIGNFDEDGSIFVMQNEALADSYRTWFEFIWDFCPGN